MGEPPVTKPTSSEARSASPLLDANDLPWLVSAVLVAIGLRLLWIMYVDVDPNDGRFADAVFFHNTAYLLANGFGYIEPYGRELTAQWPPGYPAVLALFYKLFGWHLVLAKALNVGFAAVTVALTYLVARRIFDQRVAYLSALVLACFPGQIYFSSLVLRETMFAMMFMVVLLAALVWTLARSEARWWQLLVLGMLIGAAGMVRTEGVFLVFVLAALWALTVRPFKRAGRYAVLTALGVALALTPWTARNAIQLHEFIPLRANATSALTSALSPDIVNAPIFEQPDRTVSGAIEYQVTHPWLIPRQAAKRIARFYENDSDGIRFTLDPGFWVVDHSYDESGDPLLLFHRRTPSDALRAPLLTEGQQSFWRGLADGYFFTMGAAALACAALCLVRRNRLGLLLIVAGVGWTLLFGFIPPSPRFHFALGPLISILAGGFFLFVWDGARVALRSRGAQRREPG